MRGSVPLMWMRVIVLGACVLVAIPVAGADTVDDHYLAVLTAAGISGDRGQLIGDGHAACDAYGTAGVVG